MKNTKRQEWNDAMLSSMFRDRGLKRLFIAKALATTYETLKKKMRNPELFTGKDRLILSNVMNVKIEEIDKVFAEILTKDDSEIEKTFV